MHTIIIRSMGSFAVVYPAGRTNPRRVQTCQRSPGPAFCERTIGLVGLVGSLSYTITILKGVLKLPVELRAREGQGERRMATGTQGRFRSENAWVRLARPDLRILKANDRPRCSSIDFAVR
jgi:hypothetical protein